MILRAVSRYRPWIGSPPPATPRLVRAALVVLAVAPLVLGRGSVTHVGPPRAVAARVPRAVQVQQARRPLPGGLVFRTTGRQGAAPGTRVRGTLVAFSSRRGPGGRALVFTPPRSGVVVFYTGDLTVAGASPDYTVAGASGSYTLSGTSPRYTDADASATYTVAGDSPDYTVSG